MKPFEIFAVVQPGLEQIAAAELKELGYQYKSIEEGGITLFGHHNLIYKLNLRCRILSRVLVRISHFKAKSFRELEEKLRKVPWENFLNNQALCIRVTSYRSTLYHEKAIQERTIEAISDYCSRSFTIVPTVENEMTQLVLITIKGDEAIVSIDSSGRHLHKRGYREWIGEAPLRETIAAAMLKAAQLSQQYDTLIDPMCGAGTIPLEAWMISHGIPASRFRSFSFLSWPCFESEIYKRELVNAENAVVSDSKLAIRGYDINERALIAAQHNSMLANAAITWELIDCREISFNKKQLVILNPPYGKRIALDKVKAMQAIIQNVAEKAGMVFFLQPAAWSRLNGGIEVFRIKHGGLPIVCWQLIRK